MPRNDGAKESKQGNDERVFVIVAVVMCFILGTGFCALLLVLNDRGQSPNDTPAASLPVSRAAFIQPDHPRSLVDFTLTDSSGHAVTRADLNGKILVVDFLFTSCSLTCPAVNTQMAQIQQLTTNQPDIKLVSITVDPRDDTPTVLQKYGARFGADTNRWLFLTGEKVSLYHLIGKSFLAQDLNDPFSNMPGNFSHTERIAVMDTQGNLRGYFDGLNQNAAAAVVEEIANLRNQKL
jgi:protein SCO1/2